MPFEPSKKFWQNDSCLVCQSVHSSSFEKIQHEGEVLHQKKVIVYEFLKKQLPSLGKVNPESQDALSSKLYERYIRSGAPIIGLDCIFELSVHWASTPLWICKICYASGKDLESADAHLFSSFHKRNYLREKYPERFVSLVRVQDKSEVHKHTAIEHEAALDVLHGSKGISNPPQLYVLGINKWDQEQVMQDLALDKDIYELSYMIEPVTSKHQIMSCHICGENVMSFMEEEERIKLWNIHCSTPKHQRYQLIHSAIAEVRTIERNEQPRNFSVSHEINFNEENGIFYGPTCGLEFLTTFENECFCKLCCCIVPIEEASKHFRSESHIGIFLNRNHPSKLLNIEHNSIAERNTLFLILLRSEKLLTKYHEAQQKLPILLRNLALQEKRRIETSCKSQKIGNFDAFWCQPCLQYFREDHNDSKRTHLYSMEHFDRVVKRGFFNLDEDFYINKYFKMPSSLCPIKGRFQINMTTQNHCFFGLEFVLKDEISKRFICKCCVTSFKESKLEDLGVHLRSYGHAIRALHSINPSMISYLWRCVDGSQENEVILDYLKHTPINSDDRIRLYDPILAISLNCQSSIPKKFLQMAHTEPSDRKALIGSEKLVGCVGLNTALNTTHLEMLEITKKLMKIWCHDCGQAFTCFLDRLDHIWFDHMFTRSHWHRSNMFKVNRLSANNFDERPSPFFVPAYEQEPGKKKVTWKWNDYTKAYEFAYLRLGLKDIAHRYGPNGDFFCSLCAKNLPLDQNLLERHVRSLEHVFFYAHKYLPLSIPDLEDILSEKHINISSKRKSLRRYIARLFKDTEEKLDAIPIYNLKRKPCIYESVEIAVDFDEFAIETETMDKKIEKALTPVWNFMLPCVGDIRIDKTNYEKINLDLSEESSEQKMTLEGEKGKLLNETKYNELDNNGSSAAPAPVMDVIKQENKKSTSRDRSRSRSREKSHRRHSPSRRNSARSRSRSRERHHSSYKGRSPHRHRSKSPHFRHRSRSPRKHSNNMPSAHDDPYNYGFAAPAFSMVSAPISTYDDAERAKKTTTINKGINPSDVSYNTSNRDPAFVRSRIFVGFGLNNPITRDEIIQLFGTYGKLLGCSCFTGYAFIQFSNSSEADLAVSALNGYYFMGNVLDVKLAVSGMKASSIDHYKAIEICQQLVESEPTLPGSSSKNRRSRSHSAESVSSSGSSEFIKIGKSKMPSKIETEEKKAAKIQINLLNRLAAKNKKEKSPSPPPGEFKIRHAPAPVKPPSLQDDEDEPLALRKLKSLSSMLKPKIEKIAQEPPKIELPTIPTSIPPSNPFIPISTINLMSMAPPPVETQILKFDLTKNPVYTGLPLPDLSMPPPNMAPNLYGGQVPGMMPGFPGAPIVPQPSLGASVVPPLPGAALGPWNVPTPQVLNPQQVVLKAKMELYKRDLAKINSKEDLIKYLKEQGSDKVPETEPPILFNEIVKTKKGILGADSLYQIICYGYPDLETFYCHMCDYWTTVSEIFSHLNASMHRLKYMFRSYKVYHKKAMDEPDEDARDILLQKFAEHIWKIEGSGECRNRMRCILNAEDIQRIWPDFRNYVDNSWKLPDLEEDKPADPIKPPVIEHNFARAAEPTKSTPEKEKPLVVQRPNQPQVEEKDLRLAEFLARMQSTLTEKPSDEREKRVPEEDYFARRRQRSPSPARSPSRERSSNRHYDPYGREPKRRREEYSPDTTWLRPEPSKSPELQYSMKDSDTDWENKAAEFLEKIGEKDAAEKIVSRSKRNEYSTRKEYDFPQQADYEMFDNPPGVDAPTSSYGHTSHYEQRGREYQYESQKQVSRDMPPKFESQEHFSRNMPPKFESREQVSRDMPPKFESQEHFSRNMPPKFESRDQLSRFDHHDSPAKFGAQDQPSRYDYRNKPSNFEPRDQPSHFEQRAQFSRGNAPPVSNQQPSAQTPTDNSDLQDILSVMGLSSEEVVRILQQARPGTTSSQASSQQGNYSSQTQSPGPKKTEEINRPMREYRRYVPPSPERGGANVNTRARVVREETGYGRKEAPMENQPKIIPLDVGKPRPANPNPSNYPEPWKR